MSQNIEINYLSSDNSYIPLYPKTVSSNITDFNSSVNNLVSNYVNVSPKLKANNITDFNSSVNSLISSAEEGKANILIQKGSFTSTGNQSELMNIQIQFPPDIILIQTYKYKDNSPYLQREVNDLSFPLFFCGKEIGIPDNFYNLRGCCIGISFYGYNLTDNYNYINIYAYNYSMSNNTNLVISDIQACLSFSIKTSVSSSFVNIGAQQGYPYSPFSNTQQPIDFTLLKFQ